MYIYAVLNNMIYEQGSINYCTVSFGGGQLDRMEVHNPILSVRLDWYC